MSSKGSSTAIDTIAQEANDDPEAGTLTDGFHLVIAALKLNDINTIYNVPGIPITDLGRYMQAAGMRVLSFRHEQNAGYAAAISGFLTKKPGICLTVSAPGFLNGLTALAHATTNCFPMILISGSSEREIVDLQQGDYEEMDQLAVAKPLCKAGYRVLHAEDIGIGIARAIRAAVSGRPGTVATAVWVASSGVAAGGGGLSLSTSGGAARCDRPATKLGAIRAFAISESPHKGQVISRAPVCAVKAAPSENHPSKEWPWPHLRSKEITELSNPIQVLFPVVRRVLHAGRVSYGGK